MQKQNLQLNQLNNLSVRQKSARPSNHPDALALLPGAWLWPPCPPELSKPTMKPPMAR